MHSLENSFVTQKCNARQNGSLLLNHILMLYSRNQLQDDLRENHPFFDTPLFTVGRESKMRKICQIIVNAKYNYMLRDPVTGKELHSASYKRIL